MKGKKKYSEREEKNTYMQKGGKEKYIVYLLYTMEAHIFFKVVCCGILIFQHIYKCRAFSKK